ncbi:MAG: hypothetical protein J1F32_06275, partial [Erysipelotrichales bacterium]|nr:hypothetical protein [Erysipelotrichales bacterium]
LINNDKMIERLANQLYAYQNKENKIVPALKKELDVVNKKINNLISAVENGLFNSSTQERILELEEQKHTLELSIDEETIKRPILTKDELIKCLKRYRNLNQHSEEEKQYLIDSFINSIHLFDDKVIINFNYRDGARTISINPNSSDLLEYSPPFKTTNLDTIKVSRFFLFYKGTHHPYIRFTDFSKILMHYYQFKNKQL